MTKPTKRTLQHIHHGQGIPGRGGNYGLGTLLGRIGGGKGPVQVLSLPQIGQLGIVTKNNVGQIAFIQLLDTPKSYTGFGLDLVRVKSTEDGLEFATSSNSVFTDTFTFDETVSAGAPVSLKSNGNIQNANGGTQGKDAIGFAPSSVTSGQTGQVVFVGIVSGLALGANGFTYLGTSAGTYSLTAPTAGGQTSQLVGFAYSGGTKLMFNPQASDQIST